MSLWDTAGRVCLCPQLNLLDRKWHINVRYPTQAKVRLEWGTQHLLPVRHVGIISPTPCGCSPNVPSAFPWDDNRPGPPAARLLTRLRSD
jgi:hypothetical protein